MGGGGGGGIAGPQPMSKDVQITRHGAQINFGDLTPMVEANQDAAKKV